MSDAADEVALSQCCGFTVLPVRLLGDGGANEEATTNRFHDILMKRLEPRDSLPADLQPLVRDAAVRARTVWMVNVPVHYDRDALEELVAAAGPLERVETSEYLAEGATRMRMALLVFRREGGAVECLRMRVTRAFLNAVAAERAARDGPVARAQTMYWALRPNEQAWQVELDAIVAEYDARKLADAAQRDAAAETMDADGFTIVRKGKHRIQSAGGAAVKAAVSATAPNARLRKRKSGAVLQNFYTFQLGQRRDQELKELKRKFEEDRERLKRIRANRVFNPSR